MIKRYKNCILPGILTILFIVSYLAFCYYMKNVYIGEYDEGIRLMKEEKYAEANEIFMNLGDYRDSILKAKQAQNYIDYINAKQLLETGQYEEAWVEFDNLGIFLDSNTLAKESRYIYAVLLYENGEYEKASTFFINLGDYKESKQYAAGTLVTSIGEIQETVYQRAVEYYKRGNYDYALIELRKLESDYKDTAELISQIEEVKLQRLAALSHTVSAGIQYTIGVKADGSVISTGYNVNGQSNTENWTDIVSISGLGIVTIGLKKDGTVVTTPVLNSGGVNIDTSKWKNIIAVAAGERYVVGLTQEGTVLGSGHDAGDGQLQFDDDWTDIVAIATGWRHTVGLKADGKILITGFRSDSQLKEIAANKDDWSDIITIAAGGGSGGGIGKGHTVGLKRDGTVVAVGDNTYHQCDVSTWTDIVAIAAGDWHTVGLKSDGTVVATGNDGTANFNNYKNCCSLDDWEDIIAISAGSGSTIGITADGSVITAGYDDSGKTSIADGWKDLKVYEAWKAKISLP